MKLPEQQESETWDEWMDRHIQETLSDLTRVGPEKPVGHLPIDTLKEIRIDPGKIGEELRRKGLKTVILRGKECPDHPTGVFYVYDENALRQLLDDHRQILEEAKWPVDPEPFVRHLAAVYAKSRTTLFDLVADAFADKTNPGRTKLPPDILLDSLPPDLKRRWKTRLRWAKQKEERKP